MPGTPIQPLPSSKSAQDEAAPDPAGKEAPARKRVLVMDDESSILELTGRMLGSYGYEVELTGDGDAAVALYQAAMDAGRPFDAVILDLTVPAGMGGFEAFKAMQASDPGVKAIISSGYSHEPVVLNYKKYGIAGVAPKPYKVKELLGAVEAVMGN
jgi:DNA-binding NtrC family response regulator